MWVKLDDATDDALAYLCHILPSLMPCGFILFDIRVKKNWFASTQTWRILDEALLKVRTSKSESIYLLIDLEAEIPSWQALPYECENDFYKQMLPKCAAEGVLSLWSCDKSESQVCRVHKSRR